MNYIYKTFSLFARNSLQLHSSPLYKPKLIRNLTQNSSKYSIKPNDFVENQKKRDNVANFKSHNLIVDIMSKAAGSLYDQNATGGFIANNDTQIFIEF